MADRKPAAASDSKGAGGGRSSADATAAKDGVVKREGKDDARHKTPKKRRKVNHACVYCRRSHMTCDVERPCTRCIKRNIGHLCHDEPRDAASKKSKNNTPQQLQHQQPQSQVGTDEAATESPSEMSRSSMSSTMGPPPPNFDGSGRPRAPSSSSGFGAGGGGGGMLAQRGALPLVQPAGGAAGMQGNALGHGGRNNVNQFGFSDAWITAQNFEGMNSYNPNYMVTPEVTNEFHLLNDFLHTSLLDDNGVPPEETQQSSAYARALKQDMATGFGSSGPPGGSAAGQASNSNTSGSMLPPPNVEGKAISRPGSAMLGDRDKTREYYLQAADPSGNDNPEERMARVLRAKYDAGLLKPFNYINGYARLGKYLESHIAATSKQKILRTINQFRPKFREKAQGLTDMQLVYVEMWFERQLMDYDRVFASMAVPACCWRRTGEIFRGNKEMAELIKVPVDRLRDGKIALHEILTEESMVRYWEEFGTIAFDQAHETILTACSLKNPSDSSEQPAAVKCCFSFTIRRDEHKLPALIVGNFLPHDPPPQE